MTKKILLIDDDNALREVLRESLVDEGYAVVEAINGQKGLLAAQQEKPDFIVLDMLMPLMDGITFLGEFRRTADGAATPVLILSNLSSDTAAIKRILIHDPAVVYLSKANTSLDSILATVQEKLGPPSAGVGTYAF